MPSKFSPLEKQLLALLFQPVFIKDTTTQRRGMYTIYDNKKNPLGLLKARTVANLKEGNLLKADRKGNLTLNRRTVRGLRGNSFLKKYYKTIKPL